MHSKKARKRISEGRKKWLRNNPDKHPWKSKDKFKSVPCEKFKNILKDNGITFLEEYQPLKDRFYSIDIVFPDKKIGVEINGNQHYTSKGELKPYYQERHDNIEKEGWKLYEYHYSMPYDKELVRKIVHELQNEYKLGDIDYSFYIQKKKIYKCKDCRKKVTFQSIRCNQCEVKNRKGTTKIKYPKMKILLEEIKQHGYCWVGRKYNVSDNGVRVYLKGNDITLPKGKYVK